MAKSNYKQTEFEKSKEVFDRFSRKGEIVRYLVDYIKQNGKPDFKEAKALALDYAMGKFGLSQPDALRLIKTKTAGSALALYDNEQKYGKEYVDAYIKRRRDIAKRGMAGAMRREPTQTERILLDALRKAHPSTVFSSQVVMSGYIPDIFVERFRLIIEVDGSSHDARAEYDRRRDAVFSRLQVQTVRFSNDRVLNDLPGILAEIAPLITGKPDRRAAPPIPGLNTKINRRNIRIANKRAKFARWRAEQGKGTN